MDGTVTSISQIKLVHKKSLSIVINKSNCPLVQQFVQKFLPFGRFKTYSLVLANFKV